MNKSFLRLIFISLSIVGFCFTILSFHLIIVSCEEQGPTTFELMGINNDTRIEGSFFLACGTIKEKDYYFAWVKSKKGITRITISQYNSFIEFTDKQPTITISNYGSFLHWNDFEDNWTEKIIRIPKGSILFNYELK